MSQTSNISTEVQPNPAQDLTSNAESEAPPTTRSVPQQKVEVNDSDDDLESEYQFFRRLVKTNIFQLSNVNEQETLSTWLSKCDEEQNKSLKCAYIKLMLVSLQHVDDSFGLFKSSAPSKLPPIENTPNALREIIEHELSKNNDDDDVDDCVGAVHAVVSADLTSFATSFADKRCVQVFYARSDHAINTWFLPSHMQFPIFSHSASQWERALSTAPKTKAQRLAAAQDHALDPVLRNNAQRNSVKWENSEYGINEMQGICERLMVDQIPMDTSGQEVFRWYEHSRLDGSFRPTNEICIDKDTCRHVKNQLELDERAINVTNRMYPGRIRIILDPRLIFEVIGLHLDLAGQNHYDFHSHKNTLNIKTINCKITEAHPEPDNSKKNMDQKLPGGDHRSSATEPAENCSCVDKKTPTKAESCRQPFVEKQNDQCCNNNTANTCDRRGLGNAAKSSRRSDRSSQPVGQTDCRGKTADQGQKYIDRSVDSMAAQSSCCCVLDQQCDNTTTATKAKANHISTTTAECGKSQPSQCGKSQQCCNGRFKAGSDQLAKKPTRVGQEKLETAVHAAGCDESLHGLRIMASRDRIAGGGVPRRSCSATAPPSRIPIACSRRQPRRIDPPVQLYPRSRLPVPVRSGPAPPRIPQPACNNQRPACGPTCGSQRTTHNNPCASQRNPCASQRNPCASQRNPCASERDPCASERDPCASERDPCASERDPCAAECDPCASERDPCGPPRDPCGPPRDPCGPPRDPCGPPRDPCGPPRDPCGPPRDPCGPPRDPCGPPRDPCGPPRDPCGPPRDPCGPPRDPCGPPRDPCAPPRHQCTPQRDPCAPQQDQCNNSCDGPQPRRAAENNGMEFTICGTFRLDCQPETATPGCSQQNNNTNSAIDQFLANIDEADTVAPRSLAVPGCPYVRIDEAANVPTPERWRQMMDDRSSIGSQPLSMDSSSPYRNNGPCSGSSGSSCCWPDMSEDTRSPFGMDDSFPFNTHAAAPRHRSTGCERSCPRHRRDTFDRNTC